jgi:hypothetical protein
VSTLFGDTVRDIVGTALSHPTDVKLAAIIIA